MFSQEWTIFGEFMFDSPDDFEAFKCKICEAFELCSDTPVWAESIEERSTKINAEIAHFSAHHFV